MPAISVIVPTKNSAKTLEECLASLRNQTFNDYEVIVVDGDSRDNTVEVARSFHAIVLEEGPQTAKSRGRRAMARNMGASSANGRVLVFTDSDCSFQPNWLEMILAALDSGQDALGGPDLAFSTDPPVGKAAALMESLMRKRPKDGLEAAFVIKNCNMACCKWVFDRLRGFEEAEELDFLIRAVNAGFRVHFDPNLTILHHRRKSFVSTMKQAWEANLNTNLHKTHAMADARYWYTTKDNLLAMGFAFGGVVLALSFVLGIGVIVILAFLALIAVCNVTYFVVLRLSLGAQGFLWITPFLVTVSSILRAVAIFVGWASRIMKFFA